MLLRHVGAPDDSRGIHFDFLLEDKEFCRTWRLSDIPLINGPYVNCVSIVPHNLNWLDIKEKVLTDKRGVVNRAKKGVFWKPLPTFINDFMNLSLNWEDVECQLVIDENGCRIFEKNSNYCL